MRTLALAALWAVTAAGQQKPDFTGTWKSGPNESFVKVERIVHRDPDLQIKTESHEKAGASSLPRPLAGLFDSREIRIGGPEQISGVENGRRSWRSAYWEGTSLVLVTFSKDSYRVTVSRQQWDLTNEGNTLRRTIRVIDMDGVREKVELLYRE